MTLDYGRFDALTFDCYGTLVDWEAGSSARSRRCSRRTTWRIDDEDVLVRYAATRRGSRPARTCAIGRCWRRACAVVGAELGFQPTDEEAARFGGSVADWPAFPDSTRSLPRPPRALPAGRPDQLRRRPLRGIQPAARRRLRLGRHGRAGRLVQAERRQLRRALRPARASGIDRDRILHVAQSLFHDHAPAKRLGMTSVWIDRRHDRPASGATPPADAAPDEIFTSMAAFAAAAVPG